MRLSFFIFLGTFLSALVFGFSTITMVLQQQGTGAAGSAFPDFIHVGTLKTVTSDVIVFEYKFGTEIRRTEVRITKETLILNRTTLTDADGVIHGLEETPITIFDLYPGQSVFVQYNFQEGKGYVASKVILVGTQEQPSSP